MIVSRAAARESQPPTRTLQLAAVLVGGELAAQLQRPHTSSSAEEGSPASPWPTAPQMKIDMPRLEGPEVDELGAHGRAASRAR